MTFAYDGDTDPPTFQIARVSFFKGDHFLFSFEPLGLVTKIIVTILRTISICYALNSSSDCAITSEVNLEPKPTS